MITIGDMFNIPVDTIVFINDMVRFKGFESMELLSDRRNRGIFETDDVAPAII